VALTLAVVVSACGGSASPAASVATPSPSVAATPSPSPSPSPSPVPSPSVAASPSLSTVDAAEGLKIDSPYGLTELPDSVAGIFKQQISASAGAFGSQVDYGFRTISGGKGENILIVVKFPDGTVNETVFSAMVSAMGTGMGAKLTKTTVQGIDIQSGAGTSGALALFHVQDHILFVISQDKADPLAIAKALISANN
jgi:hypothetical protein